MFPHSPSSSGVQSPSFDFGYLHDEGEWEPHDLEPSPTLQDIRRETKQLIDSQRSSGKFKPSGRILIVSHSLPYVCKYTGNANKNGGYPTPRSPTPSSTTSSNNNNTNTNNGNNEHHSSSAALNGNADNKNHDSPPKSLSGSDTWSLAPRRGHSALQSGIQSLNDTHQVVVIAWPAQVIDATNNELINVDSLSSKQRYDLELALSNKDNTITRDLSSNHSTCVPVWVDDQTAKRSYEGFCKGFLWTTFHYLALSDHADKASETSQWEAYSATNRAYAQRVAEIYQPGDVIWVHDYHLLLVPQMLRNLISQDKSLVPIGLFLHSPFPSSEFFRCLPRREPILDGMLGADLACFQTYSYGRHFLSSCVRVKGYECSSRLYGVDTGSSETVISYIPVGIDVELTERARKKPSVAQKAEALRKLYQGKKIIVGRDKLDKTKGVVPKLQAFERLLRDYPQWVGKAVLIQVTTPSASDSADLAKEVWELVDHINGIYGTLNFLPVHHYHQAIEQDEYFALLTAADMALITSIRDGMNTTSMEYILCQAENKGPLFISEFTGAAASMHAALRGNPWDLRGCARIINKGLSMSMEERNERYQQLHQVVVSQTSSVWAAKFIHKLYETIDRDYVSAHVAPLDADLIHDKFVSSKKRLMMFDYDGTLTPIVKDPAAALPPPALLAALERLCENENNVVYLISGRDAPFLQKHMGYIPNLGFSAEHGCFLREPGSSEWVNLTQDMDMSWMKDVEDMLKYYEERTTGSFVEKKAASVTFHYRNADPDFGLFQAKELQGILENLQSKLPIDVLVGKKNLEIRPAHTHKGEIVKRLIYLNPDADFLVCSGDDKTDEDMFRMITSIMTPGEYQGKVTPPGSLERYPTLRKAVSREPSEIGSASSSSSSSSSSLTTSNSNSNSNGELTASSTTNTTTYTPVQTRLEPSSVFTIAVDAGQIRKTIANWRVPSPFSIIAMLSRFVETSC